MISIIRIFPIRIIRIIHTWGIRRLDERLSSQSAFWFVIRQRPVCPPWLLTRTRRNQGYRINTNAFFHGRAEKGQGQPSGNVQGQRPGNLLSGLPQAGNPGQPRRRSEDVPCTNLCYLGTNLKSYFFDTAQGSKFAKISTCPRGK